MDIRDLKKGDPEGIHAIYDRWPEMARNAYEAAYPKLECGSIDHIVFAGMGGSGAIGDVFSAILSQTSLHVSVVKGYLLPKTVDSRTLVVVISVSGNTIEALTILESAKNLGCPTIACCSGGRMREYSRTNDIQCYEIPYVHSPRASFTTFLFAMLRILEDIVPVKRSDVDETIAELGARRDIIGSMSLGEKNPAVLLARDLAGIPLIYYPLGLQPAAIRFKNSLQENAKMHAITEDVLEACHNGIVAWEKPSNVQPVLILGEDDHPRTKERWNILKKYFEENGIKYSEVHSVGKSILAKIISGIYMLDYTSIYCAVLSGTDPSSVYSIDYIKKNIQDDRIYNARM